MGIATGLRKDLGAESFITFDGILRRKNYFICGKAAALKSASVQPARLGPCSPGSPMPGRIPGNNFYISGKSYPGELPGLSLYVYQIACPGNISSFARKVGSIPGQRSGQIEKNVYSATLALSS